MDQLRASDSMETVLRIEGEMTIYRADELKQSMLVALRETPTLEIDLSAVTEIDTAGVQLLLFARKAAAARGHALRVAARSPAVVEAFELLNLATCFGNPIVIDPLA